MSKRLNNCYEVINEQSKRCKLLNKHGSECNQVLCKRTSNLKRHLQRIHKTVYDSLEEDDKVAKKVVPPPKTILHIPMDRSDWEKFIIGMVAVHATPLSVFGGEVFREALGRISAALGVSLDRDNIRRLVAERYQLKKNELQNAIQGKGLHIKLDGCSRHNVRYFGINVQYCDAVNKIQIKTLAMRSTEHHQHTGEYIKKFVEEVMSEFEIAPVQVLSVVTDNAKNMVLGVKKLEEELELDMSEVDPDFNTDNMFGTHMRCAAHSLQLAVKDAVRSSSGTDGILNKARSLVIAARTPNVVGYLKKCQKPLPIKDMPTRWGTIFLMLERLLLLKDTLAVITETSMTDDEWNKIEGVKEDLTPSYTLGLELQSKDLTPGTFFATWMNAITKLRSRGTTLSQFLSIAMEKRGKVLFDNNVLLAGIYVDPNYRLALKQEQLRRGRDTFVNVVVHLKALKRDMARRLQESLDLETNPLSVDMFASSQTSTPRTSTSSASSGSAAERHDFEALLDTQQRQLLSGPEEVEKSSIMPYISTMESFRREKIPVMDIICNYPKELQEAARAVTALPPTQVSVERLFSSLKLVVTDTRSSLGPDLAEWICYLRNNGYDV